MFSPFLCWFLFAPVRIFSLWHTPLSENHGADENRGRNRSQCIWVHPPPARCTGRRLNGQQDGTAFRRTYRFSNQTAVILYIFLAAFLPIQGDIRSGSLDLISFGLFRFPQPSYFLYGAGRALCKGRKCTRRNHPLTQSVIAAIEKRRVAATDNPRAQYVLLYVIIKLCAGKRDRLILPICLIIGSPFHLLRIFLSVFIYCPCFPSVKPADALHAAILLRFYYTERKLGFLLPVLTPEMGNAREFPRAFFYRSIYCFNSFLVSTFNFLIASEIWLLTVFADIFRCSAISWLVQSRAASMAMANSVVVRSSATS